MSYLSSKYNKEYRMGNYELWRTCELLALKSEHELFKKRKIRASSFSISEFEFRTCSKFK